MRDMKKLWKLMRKELKIEMSYNEFLHKMAREKDFSKLIDWIEERLLNGKN